MPISKTRKCTQKGHRKWEIEGRRGVEGIPGDSCAQVEREPAQGETRAGRGMEIALEAFDIDIVGFSLLAKC